MFQSHVSDVDRMCQSDGGKTLITLKRPTLSWGHFRLRKEKRSNKDGKTIVKKKRRKNPKTF